MGNFTPSKYQQKIYDFVENGKGNAIIDAKAGSGKTTTIIKALDLIDIKKKVLFVAFNKSIVEELETRITQSNVEVSTLHSLGYKFIRDYVRFNMNNHKIQLDNNKYKRYIRDNFDELTYDAKITSKNDKESYINNLNELVNFARFYLASTPIELERIADKHSIILVDNECDVVFEVLIWGKSNLEILDFTDMIYIPNALNITPNKFKYDFVFIDECQDLNTAQRELFLKTLKKNGRFIGVGDKRQAIYSFSGADEHSFDKLSEIPNTTKLPLSISYRCPKKVINLAKNIVSDIEYRKNADEGEIIDNMSIDDLENNDMVLCRTASPLFSLYMELLKMGKSAHIKGKDIASNMIQLISNSGQVVLNSNLEENGVFTQLYKNLIDRRNNLMLKKDLNEEEATIEPSIVNQYDTIKAMEVLSENLNTSYELINRINEIFDDNEDGIILSTIHKSKGLEADNVFILLPSQLPSPLAKKDWELIQEDNLTYVAYTRAKKKLGFITESDFDVENKFTNPSTLVTELRLLYATITYNINNKKIKEPKTKSNTKVIKLGKPKKQPTRKIKKENDNNINEIERKLNRFNNLIKNLTIEDAYSLFNDLGIVNEIRTVKSNEKDLIVTSDLVVDRINVELKNNKIVKVLHFG